MSSREEALRLLLVDDDVVDRMAVVRALGKLATGHSVVQCESAKAAVEALVAERFDCVISDFEMPGDNALWLLEQMRASSFDVPLIILTGQGDEQTAVSLMKAGALDYLPKGPDLSQRLGAVVERAVRTYRAERDVRVARERLALTLEATGIGTWDYDLLSGNVLLDRRCQELLELDTRSLAFEDGFRTVCEDQRASLRSQLEELLRDPARPRLHSEHRCRTACSGRDVWVEVTGRVFWERDRPVRVVGTLADITARKREELAVQKRLEFEQQLLGIVSHDLRNPIAAMLLGARLIADEAGAHPFIGNAARRVLSSGERATRLIRDLLDFTQARLGRGLPITPAKTNVQQVCRQVIDEFALAFPRRKITYHFDADVDCTWDADRIAQALSNLLRNALSYSPPESEVRISACRDGSALTIAVQNANLAGPIPAEVLPTLFQPFRRGDRRHDPDRSIGLGLYIVHEVVRAHGGKVEVRSTASDGTTFSMRLPYVAQPLPADAIEPS